MHRANVYLLSILLISVIVSISLSKTETNVAASSARNPSQLYSRYCISCHGRNGKSETPKGKNNHARDLTDAAWQDDVSDERIFNSIMNGRNVKGNMPGFSRKLNGQEADALVGLVRGLRK